MESFPLLACNELGGSADKCIKTNRLIQNSVAYSSASSSLKQPGDGFGKHTLCGEAINIFYNRIQFSARWASSWIAGAIELFWVVREWRCSTKSLSSRSGSFSLFRPTRRKCCEILPEKPQKERCRSPLIQDVKHVAMFPNSIFISVTQHDCR